MFIQMAKGKQAISKKVQPNYLVITTFCCLQFAFFTNIERGSYSLLCNGAQK
jgi:hypothetical protein